MFAAILSWLLGGGVAAIGKQLNAAYQARLKAQNEHERVEAERLIASLEADLAFKKEQAAIVRAQLGHPVAWMPRFIIEMFTALYFAVWVIDLIWQLPGDMANPPDNVVQIMSIAVGGMFALGTATAWTGRK
jgi:hypothetical protein